MNNKVACHNIIIDMLPDAVNRCYYTLCDVIFVTVQQRQEEKRQKEELYKEKDRERKRVQSSKKVTDIYN